MPPGSRFASGAERFGSLTTFINKKKKEAQAKKKQEEEEKKKQEEKKQQEAKKEKDEKKPGPKPRALLFDEGDKKAAAFLAKWTREGLGPQGIASLFYFSDFCPSSISLAFFLSIVSPLLFLHFYHQKKKSGMCLAYAKHLQDAQKFPAPTASGKFLQHVANVLVGISEAQRSKVQKSAAKQKGKSAPIIAVLSAKATKHGETLTIRKGHSRKDLRQQRAGLKLNKSNAKEAKRKAKEAKKGNEEKGGKKETKKKEEKKDGKKEEKKQKKNPQG